jgi:hypothetical protein
MDLACIHLYGDAEGRIREAPVRRFLAVVDCVVGGEGE